MWQPGVCWRVRRALSHEEAQALDAIQQPRRARLRSLEADHARGLKRRVVLKLLAVKQESLPEHFQEVT